MGLLTYRTAGESHGKALISLVEGLPAGVPVDKTFIDPEPRRRQGGYGRGGRQKIETDHIDFLTGVRMGKTIGSPVTMPIPNKDSRLDAPPPPPPPARPPATRTGPAVSNGSPPTAAKLSNVPAPAKPPPAWPPVLWPAASSVNS